jgi:TfoX/Sxy family transcriptional regulator of competence genes
MAYDEDLAAALRRLLQDEAGLTEKRMFGGLAFLIDGNMAVSASGQGGLLLRVDPETTGELVGRPRAAPFLMRGREMDGWLRIDASVLDDEADLAGWVALGAGYARTLPPK